MRSSPAGARRAAAPDDNLHVSGEPGIGKSRLAMALVEHLGGEPAGIVKWNCAAHLADRALHPMIRDIETRAGFSRSSFAEARRAGIDALVAASPTLFAEDTGFLHDLPPESQKQRRAPSSTPRPARGAYIACWRGGWRAWPATCRS